MYRPSRQGIALIQQQFISRSFDAIVSAVNSVVFMRSVAPVLLLVGGFEFALARHTVDSQDPSMTSTSFSSIGWEQIGTSVAEPTLPQNALKPVTVSLTKPQRNIVEYVSKAYRVGFDEAARYVSTAFQVAKQHNVDPLLVVSIMSIESSFNPSAQSHAGAQGLMQVLTRVHPEKFSPFGGVASAFDVYANIYVGTRIIGEYLAREGSTEGALKSYVGAALMTDDSGYGWKVMSQMERFKAIAQGKPIPNIPAAKPVGKIGIQSQAETEATALTVERSDEAVKLVPTAAPTFDDDSRYPAPTHDGQTAAKANQAE